MTLSGVKDGSAVCNIVNGMGNLTGCNTLYMLGFPSMNVKVSQEEELVYPRQESLANT